MASNYIKTYYLYGFFFTFTSYFGHFKKYYSYNVNAAGVKLMDNILRYVLVKYNSDDEEKADLSNFSVTLVKGHIKNIYYIFLFT